MTIKEKVFGIVSTADTQNHAGSLFDSIVVATILLSVLSIILESFHFLMERYALAFRIFEALSVILFTIEYLARIWTAEFLFPQSKHPRIRYVFSAMAMVDLLAILPFYLPFVSVDLRFLRMLRLFRLLRLFKLERYFISLQIITRVVRKSWPKLMATLIACAIVMVFSAILLYTTENAAQPDAFPNVVAALWWAVCTFTTVGYGDVYPITVAGKIFASLISIVGIGIVAIPTGIISAGFVDATNKSKEEEDKKMFCPYCGHRVED